MTNRLFTDTEMLSILKVETDFERQLALAADVRQGLLWGEPRYGHPEGMVLYHIPEIFSNIDRLTPPLSKIDRERLRIITLLHDAFKYREDKSQPRDWSKHHGILARQFAEKWTDDRSILDVLELHDEAYYCWRLEVLEEDLPTASQRFEMLFDRVGYCMQLFYAFFKCDTATGDKTQAPVKWFEKKGLAIEKLVIVKNV
jgi:hypothetical protein